MIEIAIVETPWPAAGWIHELRAIRYNLTRCQAIERLAATGHYAPCRRRLPLLDVIIDRFGKQRTEALITLGQDSISVRVLPWRQFVATWQRHSEWSRTPADHGNAPAPARDSPDSYISLIQNDLPDRCHVATSCHHLPCPARPAADNFLLDLLTNRIEVLHAPHVHLA